MMTNTLRTTVLVFAGHDPCGGAGLQADIEAIISHDAHAATVCTAQTVQNTKGVQRFIPADPLVLEEQARALLNDLSVSAIKIGMVGTTACVEAIYSILIDHPSLSVVFDPVISGSLGGRLMEDEVHDAVIDLLLPRTTVLTPNSIEARQLSGKSSLEECAAFFLEAGCRAVLIKGTHEPSADITHTLYQSRCAPVNINSIRLPHEYHGSGCTLASSIAALLAQGADVATAVTQAHAYTLQTLQHAYRIGEGQWIPHRLFWKK